MGKWICWYVSTIGRGVRICIKLYTNTSYCKYYIKNPYPRGFDNTNTGWGGEHSLECQNSNSLVNITLQLNWMSHHSHDSFFSVWMFKIQSYSILTKEKKKNAKQLIDKVTIIIMQSIIEVFCKSMVLGAKQVSNKKISRN